MKYEFSTPRAFDAEGDLSEKWYVDFDYWPTGKPWDKRRKRISKGINKHSGLEERKKALLSLQSDLLKALDNGAWRPRTRSLTDYERQEIQWSVKIKRYMSWYKTRARKKSVQGYESRFRIFERWLRDTFNRLPDIHGFSKEDGDEFFMYLAEERGVGNSTFNNYRQQFNAIATDLVRRGEIHQNPFGLVNKLKTDQKPARRMFKADMDQIVSHLFETDPHFLLFIRCMFHMLLRPHSEERLMKIGWIDFNNENLTIPADISKNRIEATLPIPKSPFLKQLQYLKGMDSELYVFSKSGVPSEKEAPVNYFGTKFRLLAKELNLAEGITLYSVKHTGAIMLLESGASVKEVQMQLRHHSLDVTDRYLRQMMAVESDAIRNHSPQI